MEMLFTRDATTDDVSAMTEILNSAVRKGFDIWRETPMVVDEMLSSLPNSPAGKLALRVAVIEAEVVGWASISQFKPNYGYEHTAECSVYISKRHQGKGIGRQLVDDLYKRAMQIGSIHTLLACIDSENLQSVRLFTKAGYTQHATLPEVGHKKGSWRSLHILVKRVS